MAARCGEIQDWLPAYLDGEAGEGMRRRVEAHLAECAPCAAQLAGLGAVRTLVESLPAPEPAPEFWDAFGAAVSRRIAAVPPPRTSLAGRLLDWIRTASFLQPAPALGAAAALGLLLAFALVHAPRPVERPPVEAIAAGEVLGIGMNLEVLRDLDLLEDIDVLESLPALTRGAEARALRPI